MKKWIDENSSAKIFPRRFPRRIGIFFGLFLIFGQGIQIYASRTALPSGPEDKNIEKKKPLPLHYLEKDQDALEKLFDEAKGRDRLMLVLSPACPVCYNGAKRTVQLLKQYKNLELSVHFVWLPNYSRANRYTEYAILTKIFKEFNQDRMAAEGMKFTSFYVAAAGCSPSRAALLTGCYPPRIHRSGMGSPFSRNDARWV